MNDKVLVRSLSDLIELGSGDGRMESVQASLNTFASQGYELVGIVPDASSHPNPVSGPAPWFIFRKD